MAISQVRQAQDAALRPWHTLVRQPPVGLSLELGVNGSDGHEVVVRGLLQTGPSVVVAHLGAEQAERRQHAGMSRHHDRAHPEQRRQLGAVERPRAAEGHEREIAGIVAALHRYQPDGADHVVVDDVEDPARRRFERKAERPRHPLLDGPARPLDVERHLAAQQVRGDTTKHEVSVGDRRLLPARAVARGAGHGARALGTHRERAVVAHTRDRSAARADRVDVDHGHGQRPSADASFNRHRRFAALDQAHVGARAANVHRDHVGEARRLPDQPGADHAGGGPGERGVNGLRAHGLGAHDATVGLHDRQRRRDAALAQSLDEPPDVAADERLHVRVEHGDHRALELAEHRQHLARQRHRAVRMLLEQQLARPALVGAVGVAVQEADGHRRDAGRAQPSRRLTHGVLIERLDRLAAHADAAGNLEDQLGRHRARRLDPREHVGAPGNVVAPDLEHIAEAGRGEQARRRALAFENGVGGRRGAVQHVAERRARRAGERQRFLHAGEKALGGIVRRRRRLGDPKPPRRRVPQRDVGECPADIESDRVTHKTLRGLPIAPSAKREKRKPLMSSEVLPSAISSDTRRPAIGPIAKPWPLNPVASTKPRSPGTSPRTGTRSGVASM